MMRMLRDWGVALAVGVVVFWVAEELSQRGQAGSGELAPDFLLSDLDGGQVRLSDLRGQTVVVNFWATWCGPCKKEIPEFTEYARENPDVKVLGVVVPSNEGDRLDDIVRRFKVGYPVLVSDDATEAAYGIDSFPTTYVVRADGTIGGVQVGGMNKEMLAEMVEAYGG